MRRFSIVLAFVFPAFVAAPAGAASFDCAKATTPLEIAICARPALSGADETMAAAFSAARGLLSPAASAVLLDNQRNWLAFAERACTDDAEPKTAGHYDDDAVECLTSVFDQRIRILKAVGPVGELMFYSVDEYAVAPDPDPESWSRVGTTEISFAQMDGDGAEAKALNAHVHALAEPLFAPPFEDAEEGTADVSSTIAVRSVTPQLITLVIDEYVYGHGAAHGNYVISFSSFLRAERREVIAGDVFAGGDWALALKPLVIERLAADAEAVTGETNMLWDDFTNLEDAIADPSRWEIGPDGIAFQFQPYEVAAYAYGAPQALMTWDELSPFLVPGARDKLIGR